MPMLTKWDVFSVFRNDRSIRHRVGFVRAVSEDQARKKVAQRWPDLKPGTYEDVEIVRVATGRRV